MTKSSAKINDEGWEPPKAETAKWIELMNRHDTVGIRYLKADQLRGKPKLNKSELTGKGYYVTPNPSGKKVLKRFSGK
jgi:hypothetical protein